MRNIKKSNIFLFFLAIYLYPLTSTGQDIELNKINDAIQEIKPMFKDDIWIKLIYGGNSKDPLQELFDRGPRQACIDFANLAESYSNSKYIENKKRSIEISKIIFMIKEYESDFCGESNMLTHFRMGKSYADLNEYAMAFQHYNRALYLAKEILPKEKEIIDDFQQRVNLVKSKMYEKNLQE